MKRLVRAALALAGLFASSAQATKWVEYSIHGRGGYYAWDVSTDPTTEESGNAELWADFFVEIEPGEAESGPTWYSDGKTFGMGNREEWFSVTASEEQLRFEGWTDMCGYVCTTWNILLNFPSGSLDNTLPGTFPHLSSGSFSYSEMSHWQGYDASGRIMQVTSRVVNEPQIWTLGFALTPSSVPEPASWAMMLGGLGLIGGAMRRRRTSVRFA